jgi:ATP-dependent RNA helicase DHX8/PRP22
VFYRPREKQALAD